MDTPEGTGPSVYDGFISYSHAADDLLAPRLQSALQRFAKPWWKRRAVRIFRDESSLSANPHLWSSITEALDTSGWFVLLLSPDAAESEWVNQEIAYWVENRDPKRILPVVTDGTFGWADDVMTGSAVPAALEGVFTEEPRWVDMRFARGEEQLDLKNPEFAAAVADIASAIRGVPKDELASEEVRQHRRTVRTAWGAGIVTAALAVAAIGFGIDARNERNRADEQAALAQEEATRASNEAERANQLASDEAAARADADASAADAQRNAQEARARELAAAAIGVVDDDPQLAMLLALESFDALPEALEPGQELKRALREAVHASSVVELVPVDDPYSYIDLSPNGEVLVISSGTTLRAVQADTLEELWTYEETGPDTFEYVGFSTEGRFVTLTVADQNWFVSNHRQYANVFGEPIDVVVGPDGEPARLLVFDAATGQIAQRLEFEDDVCAPIAVPGSLSDGHGLLAVGLDKCDFYADSHEAVVYDTATWQIVHRLSAWEGASGVFAASPESDAVMFTSGWTQYDPFGESVALKVGSWETLHQSDLFTFGAFSPDGSLFAGVNARPNEEYPEWTEGTLALVDTETWKILHLYKTEDDINHYAVRFSPDGSRIYVGSISGNTTAFSVDRRDLADVYASGEAVSLAIGDTEAFMTTTSGTLQRWDTTGILRGELSSNIDDYLGATNGVLVAGESRLLWQFGDFQALSPLNPDGSIGRSEPVLWGSLAPLDGDRVVTFDINHPERTELGPLIEIDLRTGDRQSIAGCFVPIEEAMYGEPLCENGSVHPSGWLFPSLDGLEFINVPLALTGRTEPSEVTVWDGMTFEVTQTVVLDDVGRFYDTLRGMLTPDRILLWDAVLSEAVIFDRFTGEQLLATKGDHPFGVDRGGRYLFITDHEAGEVLRVDLATLDVVTFFGPVPARLQSLGISPSGASVAITGEDGFVRIVDAESRALLEVVPLENAAGLGWIDETHVGVGTNDDFWTVITLEVDELTELARSQLVRDFTDEECVLYRLDCGGP